MDIFFIEMVASREDFLKSNKRAGSIKNKQAGKTFFSSEHAPIIETPEYAKSRVTLRSRKYISVFDYETSK